jgi:hypothetical protein
MNAVAKITGSAVALIAPLASTRLTAAERLAVRLDALGVPLAEIIEACLAEHKTRMRRKLLNVAKAKSVRLAAKKYGRAEPVIAQAPQGYYMSVADQRDGRGGTVPVDEYDLNGTHRGKSVLRHQDVTGFGLDDQPASFLTVFEAASPLSTPATLANRHRKGCCAPVEGEGAATLFCNAEKALGSNYCGPHKTVLTMPKRHVVLGSNSETQNHIAAARRFESQKRNAKLEMKSRFRSVSNG